MVTQAAFFAVEVACFLQALGYYKVRVLNTGSFYLLINCLDFCHVDLLRISRMQHKEKQQYGQCFPHGSVFGKTGPAIAIINIQILPATEVFPYFAEMQTQV